MRGLDDGVQHGVQLVLGHHHLDLDLGEEVDDVFGAAVELGMPLLAAKSLHLGHRQPGHADVSQGFTHLVELERFDDGGNLLHDWPLVIVCSRAWRRTAADAALSGWHFTSHWRRAFPAIPRPARPERLASRIGGQRDAVGACGQPCGQLPGNPVQSLCKPCAHPPVTPC
ncbi:hypothetical protein D3C72_1713210 [compost metagenome]